MSRWISRLLILILLGVVCISLGVDLVQHLQILRPTVDERETGPYWIIGIPSGAGATTADRNGWKRLLDEGITRSIRGRVSVYERGGARGGIEGVLQKREVFEGLQKAGRSCRFLYYPRARRFAASVAGDAAGLGLGMRRGMLATILYALRTGNADTMIAERLRAEGVQTPYHVLLIESPSAGSSTSYSMTIVAPLEGLKPE